MSADRMSTAMNSSLKSVHDRLMAEKPEDAVHDSDGCPLCAMDEGGQAGDEMTYSDEELASRVEAAVEAAKKPLEDRIAELETEVQTTEVEQAKAALRASFEPQIAELQTRLDEAVLEAANAATQRDAIVTWLEAESVAAEERETMVARRQDRLSKIREVANFPEGYLEANIDRFAAMSDEDFAAACDSWSQLSAVKPDTIPEKTALHAARDGATTIPSSSSSAVKELFAMRREHGRLDLSTL